MRQTSLDAYHSIFDKLGDKQRKIYETLCVSPMTNTELSEFLHWPINTVTPRSNELVKKELIRYAGTKIYPGTQKRQIVWQVVDQEKCRQLIFTYKGKIK